MCVCVYMYSPVLVYSHISRTTMHNQFGTGNLISVVAEKWSNFQVKWRSYLFLLASANKKAILASQICG